MNEQIFLDHINQNKGIIYKLTGLYASDMEEKKDLSQEILYQAWKGWPSFKGEAKFSTWLYRLCLNTILTQKRKKNIVVFREELGTISPAVLHDSLQNEDARRLQKAIRLLAETDRAIISMNLDGFGNDEIASMTGISANNVAVKLHRIKNQLSVILNS